MESIGGYELEAVIGAGTSATVWRARRREPVDGVVAIKRARATVGSDVATTRAALLREATILAELDHPHIVRVFDVLDDGRSVAIVMQLASGGSLRALLDAGRVLSAGEIAAVAGPIADALASAHHRGLSHGDVKPENVLFTADGAPLVSDFGAARHLGAPGQPGMAIAGTAPYLDPDLSTGAPPCASNDLYALGVVCYEALTGHLPHGCSAPDVLARPGRADHLSLTTNAAVPDDVARVVERAISRRPADRQASVGQFARDLRAAVPDGSVRLPGVAGFVPDGATPSRGSHGTHQFGPRPSPPPIEHREPLTRRAVAAALALAAVVALAGIWGVRWWSRAHAHSSQQQAGSTGADRSDRRGVRCSPFPALDVSRGGRVFDVDLNGDGCPVPVAWDGRVLTARFQPGDRTPRSYEVGLRGDVLLFGDWDCDGAQSPALYRPSAGEVLYVNSFGARIGDRSYAEHIAHGLPRRGTARVVGDAEGCQDVHVARHI